MSGPSQGLVQGGGGCSQSSCCSLGRESHRGTAGCQVPEALRTVQDSVGLGPSLASKLRPGEAHRAEQAHERLEVVEVVRSTQEVALCNCGGGVRWLQEGTVGARCGCV